MIRAVTLDAAGTLFAPREPVGDTYARVARRHGVAADPGAVDARFRRAFGAAPPLAFPDAGAAECPARERAWWRDIVGAALGLGGDDPRLGSIFEALFAHYAAAAAWVRFDDVMPALAALRARGLRLAVVSNFDGRLPGILDGLGLAPAFDAVVWSTAVGAAKPSRIIFEAAAERLGVRVEEICHAGDDRHADVDGARLAGARGVHLDRRRAANAGAIATLGALLERLDIAQA